MLAATAGPADTWTAFCLREADLVVAVTRGTPGQDWLARPAAVRGCELLVIGSSIAEATVRAIAPREVQILAGLSGQRPAVEALARRAAGRAVGIVLSGGGARGFAHLGVLDVLDVLQEAGVQIDRFGGVSLGALVAAFSHQEEHEVICSTATMLIPSVWSLRRHREASLGRLSSTLPRHLRQRLLTALHKLHAHPLEGFVGSPPPRSSWPTVRRLQFVGRRASSGTLGARVLGFGAVTPQR